MMQDRYPTPLPAPPRRSRKPSKHIDTIRLDFAEEQARRDDLLDDGDTLRAHLDKAMKEYYAKHQRHDRTP